MNAIPVLDFTSFCEALRGQHHPHHRQYYAFYSSLLSAITTDPRLMLVPLDDHMVHRGDAVFEVYKCVQGSIYNIDAHLRRLEISSRHIGIALPWTSEQITDISVQAIRASGRRDCLIRLFLSRGPGSQGVSPYDCPHPALYLLAYESKPAFMEIHPQGAKAIPSVVPVKNPPFANIKSVNYLPNAMMKKEAADAGVDFAIGFDPDGFMAEGATENIGIVSESGELLIPHPRHILLGTTLQRGVELSEQLVKQGALQAVREAHISRDDLRKAREILVLNTTSDVVSITWFDGHPVGDGKPGPVGLKLLDLLRSDVLHNRALGTPVFTAHT